MPALRSQTAETLLKELQWRWTNHKVMVRWLSKFFNYLDRCCLTAGSVHGGRTPPTAASPGFAPWQAGRAPAHAPLG